MGLAVLYLRAANALDRSAQLAEHHAQRERYNGRLRPAELELERAERARAAAQRGRALAAQMSIALRRPADRDPEGQ